MKLKFTNKIAYIFIFFNLGIQAENLQEIYELALKNDPLLKSAEASYKAGKENRIIGISGLLPNIGIQGSTNWNEYRIQDQLIEQYNSNSYGAQIQQPVFRLDRWFDFKRGNALSKSAKAEFAYQQQETIIRVATAYFNVLNAIDKLNTAKAEEKAIGKQKDLAKKRYDVGLAAITELQETQAAYDLTVVARIATEAELDRSKEILSAIIGTEAPLLSPLKNNFIIINPEPIEREEWVKKGLANNFQLKSARYQVEAAKNSARSASSNHLPQIDLVGGGRRSTSKQGKFGGFIQNPLFGIEQDTRQYSLQVNIPLFAGGAISASRRQAHANYERSREQAIYTERSTVRDIRSNHYNVQAQVANVTARKQALTSANSAIEATQIGFEVGSRNTVDLLDAQKRLFSAERDYANSRYDYVIAMLRLKASVGSLSPGDIIEISNQMN